jgi:hypothetical protein
MFSYRYHFLSPNYALDQFWASHIEIFHFLKFILGELCLDFFLVLFVLFYVWFYFRLGFFTLQVSCRCVRPEWLNGGMVVKIWEQHYSVLLPSVVGTWPKYNNQNKLSYKLEFPYVCEGTGYVSKGFIHGILFGDSNNTASDSGQALKHLCGLEV